MEEDYAALIEGDAPFGAECHTILTDPDQKTTAHRTLIITRSNGTRWHCRFALSWRISIDHVFSMPDGKSFCAGPFVVDRDDPTSVKRIISPHEIVWSEERDLVIVSNADRMVAFGKAGLLWDILIPGADFKQDVHFDFIYQGRVVFFAAQHERDAGERVFMYYSLDTATGDVKETWLAE